MSSHAVLSYIIPVLGDSLQNKAMVIKRRQPNEQLRMLASAIAIYHLLEKLCCNN